ncbi:XRE family transcriptional regulator [Caldicellulosiruptor morganii]|uniref:XRE family transcriptional regulator n=2 Tax=Caldicellulosiruptor morganii TaxID=1387555 RepID=A0ABY7BNE7_9FIRM|nr:XRE family transcriptional regulator [Caldicellulosiruptor morganii]WAM34094.1 XRE family transcriptional regulator [Caldicellulosiruptor morganii]
MMSFDFKLLGKKIRQARENMLIEKEEIAKALGYSVTEYDKIENGDINEIDGDVIVIISQILGRDFRYFVSEEYSAVELQIRKLFRQNGTLNKNDRIAIQQFVRLCEEKKNLEEIIGRKKVNPEDYSQYFSSTKSYKEQGIIAAYAERKRLGIEDEISDIYNLLRQQNIHIFRKKLDDSNISGVYINHPYAGHCVLINYCEDVYRQIFSLAHEYCHVLFDSNVGQDVSYINKNNSLLEIRANYFARHFLLPDTALEKYKFNFMNTTIDQMINMVVFLSEKYKVNPQVVIYRLEENKCISSKTKETLLSKLKVIKRNIQKVDPEKIELSKRIKNKFEDLIEKGISLEYLELVRSAYQGNYISFGKAMESLMIGFDDGKTLFELWDIYMEV